jgi:hypothetical protein
MNTPTTIRKKYHQSELHCFLKCGLQWDFRYNQKIRIPPRSALTVGRAVDTSVNANMTRKVQARMNGAPLASQEEIEALAADTFDKEASETAFEADEKPGELKDQVVALSRLHFTQVAPLISPETVQLEFVIEMEGNFDLGGTLDLTDTLGNIRDTKTSSRARASSYVVNRSFQPAMYDFAYRAVLQKAPTGFVFDVLKKPTVKIGPEYQATTGVVTEADHAWLFGSIKAVHKAITAGVALPAPEGC